LIFRPHRFLNQRGLITEESNEHQYRFRDIVDLDDGKPLFTIIRRSLRNWFTRGRCKPQPAQNTTRVRGHDAAHVLTLSVGMAARAALKCEWSPTCACASTGARVTAQGVVMKTRAWKSLRAGNHEGLGAG
jgi:hypothetical protein